MIVINYANNDIYDDNDDTIYDDDDDDDDDDDVIYTALCCMICCTCDPEIEFLYITLRESCFRVIMARDPLCFWLFERIL